MKRYFVLMFAIVFFANADDVVKPGKYFPREVSLRFEDGRTLYMEIPKEQSITSSTIKGNIFSLKGKLQCEVIDNWNRLHKMNLIYDLYFRDPMSYHKAEKAMKERKFVGLVGVIGRTNFKDMDDVGVFTVEKVIDAKPDVVED